MKLLTNLIDSHIDNIRVAFDTKNMESIQKLSLKTDIIYTSMLYTMRDFDIDNSESEEFLERILTARDMCSTYQLELI